jgi:hypothetical protein
MWRPISVVLLGVCVFALAGHVATDHAHADVLSAPPLATHQPGDAHHESAPPCDAVRAATAASAVTVASAPLAVPVTAPLPGQRVADGPSAPPPFRPLFLLHAALLI